ncbi:MAG: glycoside hydrolase family 92 protein [Clostridia bacterium]|nr:glycoside hydrolase family 92 protein [Clostridia bacterium]
MLYKDFGDKSVNAILNISDTLKKIPCSIGLTDKLCCEEQAKMLALYVLLDAYNYGVKTAHLSKIESVFMTELNRDDFKIFLQNGVFERYTHILDVTDICFYLSKLTNDVALKNLLNTLSKNWINAYGKDGLMSESSQYYEGDKYTYSFRLQANIDERISLVNGKKEYEKLLDAFFGFGKTSIKQITDVDAAQAIFDSHHHRFEGFNNECDMETPYSYIYVGRHDKLCEILHECVNYSFALGKGGLPGNNDSGGLSSCFLFNYLGIFPIAGSGKFLLGAPSCKKATINLFNGKKLVINAHNLSNENYFVQSVCVNGNKVSDFTVSCNDIFNGCVIDFYMQNQKKKFDI